MERQTATRIANAWLDAINGRSKAALEELVHPEWAIAGMDATAPRGINAVHRLASPADSWESPGFWELGAVAEHNNSVFVEVAFVAVDWPLAWAQLGQRRGVAVHRLTDGLILHTELFSAEADQPNIFASIIKVHSQPGTNSDLTYPVGKPTQPGGPRTQINIPLGPRDPDPGAKKKRLVRYAYEVIVDKSNDANCPYTTKGYVRNRVITAGTMVELNPPADPANNDKGGLDSPKWPEDKNPRSGVNVADLWKGSDATHTGYADLPGFGDIEPEQLPAEYHAQFLIEVKDCHGKPVECVTFNVDIEIDKDGKVTKNAITAPVAAKCP